MGLGGKRKGAGRPKGSKNLRRFQDYWTEKEIKEFVEAGKDRYMDSDKVYIEFVQQIFGKAPQAITGLDGGALIIEISEHVQKKNASHSGTNRNS